MNRPTTKWTTCRNGAAWRIGTLVAATAVATVGAWAGAAGAAACEKPVCPSGDTYRDGFCYSRAGPPTFAESRWRANCETGWTLDATRGICAQGECCAKPLCPDGERFSRSETYRGRPYGVCESGPGIGGVLSHAMRECESGWDLDGTNGECRKRGCGPAIAVGGLIVAPQPAEVVHKPDLTIRDWWIQPRSPGVKTNEVKAGRKYQVCYVVANVGTAPSGPFVVQGGGLGVASGPTQRQATLAPTETREGCLDYSTTPPPGTYRLIVAADAPNAVDESNESNNGRSEAITVVP